MQDPEKEFFRRVAADELSDKAEVFGLMTPREYARLRGMAPQLVYYRIRNHRIERIMCDHCGREGLIRVGEADEAFGFKQEVHPEDESASEGSEDSGS